MAKLAIKLLGPYRAELDGQPLTDFRSDKVRALLAYLAVEAQRPWTRDQLADLFWPDYQETKAQANLRNALSNLRRLIGDVQAHKPYVLITGSILQFNPGADYELDVNAFLNLTAGLSSHLTPPFSDVNPSDLQRALAIYQGNFMTGVNIDSPAFETWIVKTREHLRQRWVGILRCLSLIHHQKSQLDLALDYADAWIEQEPWEEEAYRHSMAILSALGHRNAALARFEACQKRLAEDLGIEPDLETVRLYEHIKQGLFAAPASPVHAPQATRKSSSVDPDHLPDWLQDRADATFEPGLFVARQEEVHQLHTWLADAFQGSGRAVFIMGEPGSGKTYLLKAFVNLALAQNPGLLVLWGQCNAFTGQGDPYFPFMSMIRLLAGDIESLIPSTVISQAHTQRIWHILPESLASLVQHGPDMVRRFLPFIAQFSLASSHPGVAAGLLETIQWLINKPSPARVSQPILNDQFTQVLSDLSRTHPLILILDDLQWIDPGSTSLLFHFGRLLPGKRILLLGAFRPEEVWHGYKEQVHPLEGIIHEFQAAFGEMVMDLAESKGQGFVDALLDSEPNAFSPNFYRKLYQHTNGHPLFTIELLRGMQLRNEIHKNKAGQWVEGPNLNWHELPARVEAVIAKRISMMPIDCQDLMAPACVQGEVFSIEVLSQVTGKPEPEVFDLLSRQVCKRHRLITPQGITQIGDQRSTQYCFRHLLFQIYLYNHLDILEKTRLHGLVGAELEKRYRDHFTQFPEMAHTLARHFELGQITDKAVQYYTLAGKNALRLTAHQEAVQHFYHALDLLESLPPSPQRDQAELDLQLSLGPPLTALKGWGAPELENAYDRAQSLTKHSDDTTQLIPVLWLLATFRIGRSEHTEANHLVARLFRLAQQTRDPALLTLAYMQISPFYQGKMSAARILLERAAALQDINQQRFLAHRFGFAPAVIALTYLGNCLWLMGFPDQADEVNDQAFEMAETIGHPMTTCYVTSRSCWIGVLKSDLDQVQAGAEQLYRAAARYGFKNFQYAAVFFKNWGNFINHEDRPQAIKAMNDVIEAYYATKTILNRTAFLVFFAQVCLAAGDRRRGLERVSESIQLGEETGELWFQAEAWRTKGELLLVRDDDEQAGELALSEAQNCFETARQIAREQDAKAFELRAALSLARVWQGQGRADEAYQVLAEVYGWFTEGFQTADLQEACRFLESYVCWVGGNDE